MEYHDPFVPELAEDGAHMSSVALTDQALAEADAVVIVTDHTDIDYARVLEQAAVLLTTLDCSTAKVENPKAGHTAGGRSPRKATRVTLASLTTSTVRIGARLSPTRKPEEEAASRSSKTPSAASERSAVE